MENKRLYRSEKDKVIAGVCGGLAAYFNIDTVIVRLIFLLGFIFGFSSAFWIYLILWFILPTESSVNTQAGSSEAMQRGASEIKEKVEDVVDTVKKTVNK